MKNTCACVRENKGKGIQPAFTLSELAKAYYNTDLFNTTPVRVTPLDGKSFAVIDVDWVKNNSFDILSKQCLFTDGEGGCKLPESCIPVSCFSDAKTPEIDGGSLGSSLLNNKDIITSTSDISNHDIMNGKYNAVLYYLMYMYQDVKYDIVYSDDAKVKVDYNYKLVVLDKDTITAIREVSFTSLNAVVNSQFEPHNKVALYMMRKNLKYHNVMVDCLNTNLKKAKEIKIPEHIKNSVIVSDEVSSEIAAEISKLLRVYYFVNNPAKYKYINKYFKKVQVKYIRYLIYTLANKLFVSDGENMLLKEGNFFQVNEVSAFNIPATDLAKEYVKIVEEGAVNRLEILLNTDYDFKEKLKG